MALHSNLGEFADISNFCRELTKDYFRFDPLLHLRYDGNPTRNAEILAERLTPEEIVQLEQADPQRSQSLRENCGDFILSHQGEAGCDHLFHCGIGMSSFCIGHDASYRLCSTLTQPDCTYDLRKGNLEEAWFTFTPKIRDLRSGNRDFLDHCHQCPLVNLCLWCPANASLESGQLDGRSEYFCQVAHARAAAIQAPLLED